MSIREEARKLENQLQSGFDPDLYNRLRALDIRLKGGVDWNQQPREAQRLFVRDHGRRLSDRDRLFIVQFKKGRVENDNSLREIFDSVYFNPLAGARNYSEDVPYPDTDLDYIVGLTLNDPQITWQFNWDIKTIASRLALTILKRYMTHVFSQDEEADARDRGFVGAAYVADIIEIRIKRRAVELLDEYINGRISKDEFGSFDWTTFVDAAARRPHHFRGGSLLIGSMVIGLPAMLHDGIRTLMTLEPDIALLIRAKGQMMTGSDSEETEYARDLRIKRRAHEKWLFQEFRTLLFDIPKS